MNVAFWLKNWRKFFPKKSALVIDSKLLIEVMRRAQHKETRDEH